jgi:hypothetical protein
VPVGFCYAFAVAHVNAVRALLEASHYVFGAFCSYFLVGFSPLLRLRFFYAGFFWNVPVFLDADGTYFGCGDFFEAV